MNEIWQQYYQDTNNAPASELLKEALSFVKDRNSALDLGAGALKDSKFLLSQNFHEVIAIDKEPIPQIILNGLPKERFKFIQSSFTDYEFPIKKYDLINAEYSLPFSPKESFVYLISQIKNSLVIGGIFSGQLFGINDEWNIQGTELVFHSLEEVKKLFIDFEIIKITEVDTMGEIGTGEKKHWHIFNIILRNK